jgi:glycosyltransferase involved in cell wall biosynthesis
MEAMASGCAVVSTALGALPETAAGNPLVAPTAGWLDRWEAELVRVLKDDDAYAEIAARNLDLTARRDWSRIAEQWVQRFHQDSLYPSSTRSPMG